jgi:hypothetical protein
MSSNHCFDDCIPYGFYMPIRWNEMTAKIRMNNAANARFISDENNFKIRQLSLRSHAETVKIIPQTAQNAVSKRKNEDR